MAYPLPVISAGLSTSPPESTASSVATLCSWDTYLTIAHTYLVRFEHIASALVVALSNATTAIQVFAWSARARRRLSSNPERDKGFVGSRASRRSPFPFSGNPKTSPGSLSVSNDGAQLSQGPSSPVLLSPPTIVEVEPTEEDGNKALVADGAPLVGLTKASSTGLTWATHERLTIRLGGRHAARCNSPSPQPSRSAAESPAVRAYHSPHSLLSTTAGNRTSW
ncbi:hypothetical protein DICSQDRAFT_175964 [Dichomitus squalens LYAD-421 SS1]|uniref:Uncharacterized protein n=1 Tax=Dichomitus squalens (strain LYAD-421) TaxID=732165 RepID=R7SI37_DICSQ|nr:uncharacterized protein DICSQDRAFT_175964 [Dichomitus squalens LYAD-421 SS1]EJF55400.1 hypothetical protein DICSQDRAFT_175964 [Dichomitus squalens LYAD-421 SS1]